MRCIRYLRIGLLYRMLGDLNKFMNTPKQYKFVVTVDDSSGTGAYRYTFMLPEDVSQYDVAKSVATRFDVPVPAGKHIPTDLEVK